MDSMNVLTFWAHGVDEMMKRNGFKKTGATTSVNGELWEHYSRKCTDDGAAELASIVNVPDKSSPAIVRLP